MTLGVRQGCPLSPLLFGLFFDRVAGYLSEILAASSSRFAPVTVACLAVFIALYADDVALVACDVPAL